MFFASKSVAGLLDGTAGAFVGFSVGGLVLVATEIRCCKLDSLSLGRSATSKENRHRVAEEEWHG